jgi:hypothetical protein
VEQSDRLSCPNCASTVTPGEALAAGSVSWPTQRWVLFTCPNCREPTHLLVRDGYIALGQLDGGPGPVWCATSEVIVPGFRVDRGTAGFAKTSGISVQLGEQVFWFPAKGAPA